MHFPAVSPARPPGAGAPVVPPFGKYSGQPPSAIQADYLLWMLKTCKLSSGLRAAVRAELLARAPPEPPLPPDPAPAPPPACPRCGGGDLRRYWQRHAGGRRRAIRADCRRCGCYVCFLPQTAENVAAANADRPPTS